MNVFGAFTFGSLIKTFIPGFVWLVALWLLWRGGAALFPALAPIPDISDVLTQNNLVVAIPVAIVLGLLSNIVVFMGINDALVRHPVRRQAPELFGLYDKVAARIRDYYCDKLNLADPRHIEGFNQHADVELLILQTIGLDQLAYVREQYWYHMEFQVNLLLAAATGLVGLLAEKLPRLTAATLRPAGEWAAADVVVVGGICWFLLRAARKNYRRHVAKMTTIMAAAIVGKFSRSPFVGSSDDS